MENCTKYRLKTTDELSRILAERDQFFVISCNKCFQEFESRPEDACETFCALAEDWGKTVTGTARLDFLCSQRTIGLPLKERIPQGTEHIVVISCGLGVRTVADQTGASVFAACDTVNRTGHHGMALTEKTCDACAQCYLNLTGGICPITACSKGLLNGQCGGAKNGMCEIDPTMECGWERIMKKLAQLDRLDALKSPVQLRDYAVDPEV